LGFNNRDGRIRAHDTADAAFDAVIRPGLIYGKMSLGVHLVSYFQNIFGTEIDTQTAALAAFVVNDVLKCHVYDSLF
jgi:hypothetical protein